MAIVRVHGPDRNVTLTNSLVVTLANTPTAGNLLIACISCQDSNPIVNSITETNVVWTKQVSKKDDSAKDAEIWVGVVSASASTTVTIALSANADYGGIANICEYSGLLTTSFLDKTATNNGNSASPDTGTTAATTQNDELWIGCLTGYNALSSPTNGFTLIDGTRYDRTGSAYLEKIVSATGAANSGCSMTSNYWSGCIATFKAAAGGGGVSVKKGSSVVSTMAQMLNSKMLFSIANPYSLKV